MSSTIMWVGFNAFVVLLLAFDLGFLHKKSKVPTVSEALWMSLLYFFLALVFCGGIFWSLGDQKGLEFLTGYLIEKSLSIDNIFVFVLVFSHFSVPQQFQYRIYFGEFWGHL